MSAITLYIATSLDGYIARDDGSIDWLNEFSNLDGLDYGYSAFIKTIDTVVLGRKTYEEVLGFGVEWPYANCTSYVVTRNSFFRPSTDNTMVIQDLSQKVIRDIRTNSQRNIWIIGGGKVISEFLNLDEVDEITLSIVPIILGSGIRLFPGEIKETQLELVDAQSYHTGVMNLKYKKR